MEDVLNDPNSTPKEIYNLLDPNSTATTEEIKQATQALEDAVQTAKAERDVANTDANDVQDQVADTSSQAVKDAVQKLEDLQSNPQVAKAQKDLQDALDAAANDKGTTQAIENATNALNHAVARAEASSVDTAPVSQEPGVTEAQQKVLSKEANVANAQLALDKLASDPTAATDDVATARKNLEDAINEAKQDRATAEDAAKAAQDVANASVESPESDTVTDNQQNVPGDGITISSDYETVLSRLKASGGGTATVTVTAMDASGNTTDWTVKLTLIETSPSNSRNTALTYDNDSNTTQVVKYIYADVTEPVVASDKVKNTMTASTTGAPATEADFLKAINYVANTRNNDGASQAAVVTYVPVEQKVRVDLYDEVGRPLTDSQGKQQYILTGQTNNKVDYTQIAPEVPGYTLTHGAENTPAFPQANQTLTNGTDQITTGTITAPKGYKIDTVPQVAGMVWNIATDGSSATYTITFDVVAHKVKGYTYTVTGPDGVVYNTMADALAANPNFDETNNGSSDTDAEMQQFVVNYKADQQTATITQQYAYYADENGVTDPEPQNTTIKLTASTQIAQFQIKVPDGATSVSQSTSTVRGDTGKTIEAPDGYTDEELSGGTTTTVNTQNGRTDKDYSYEYTAPSGYYVADDGITTDGKGLISGVILSDGTTVTFTGKFDNNYTAPSGYYIAAINGDQYNVTYNDAATEAEYTLLWDDTPNGNAATDSKPQNLVVIFAPGNQRATVSQTMPFTYDDTNNSAASDSDPQNFEFTLQPATQQGNIMYSYSNAVSVPSDAPADESLSGKTGQPQSGTIKNTADYQSANVTFSGAPMSSVAFVGETSATLESTKFTADSGYYFDAQQPSYSGATTSVSSDGKELWVRAINFGDLESSLAVSGYGYTVTVIDDDGNRIEYATLSAAVAAVGNYDNTVNGSNQSDSSAQAFDVNHPNGSTSGPYATLQAAYDDNPVYDDDKKGITTFIIVPQASYQEAVVNIGSAGTQSDYATSASGVTSVPEIQTARVIISETTGDEHAGEVLSESTGNTNEKISFTLSDGSDLNDTNLQKLEMTKGYTYTVIVEITSGRVSFATSDSDLARSGYRYTISTPDGTTFTTLSSALAGSTGLYDNTANAGASDASAQQYTVNYHATLSAASVANNVYDSTNNIGNSDADIQTFTVSYVAQYQSAALIAGSASNLPSNVTAGLTFASSAGKSFIISYVALKQQATIVGDANSPIYAGYQGPTTSGVTNGSMALPLSDGDLYEQGYSYVVTGPDGSEAVHGKTAGEIPFRGTDSLVNKPGYSYIVYYETNGERSEPYATLSAAQADHTTFDNTSNDGTSDADMITGPDGSTYSTLSSAVAANSLFDNTTNTGSIDGSVQSFMVSYTADSQIVVLAVDSKSPIDRGSVIDPVTDRRIQGFYVVYTADSQSAVVQVATDSPINGGQTLDSAAGVTSGSISFAANTENSLYSPGYHYTPYSSQSVADSASGVTSGSLGFSISDGDLALSGYHYTVWGRYGSRQYATLSAAVGAESSFDNTDNGSVGQLGYTYTVTGPDGTVYSNLASALANNGLYDNTNNLGPSDVAVQSFMVSYSAAYQEARVILDSTGDKYNANNTTSGISDANPDMFTITYSANTQSAVIAVTSTSPISAGSLADSASGSTSGTISFAKDDQASDSPISANSQAVMSANGKTGSTINFLPNGSFTTADSQLAVSGYTYTLTYGSDSTSYATLSAAVSAHLSGYTYQVGYGPDATHTTYYSTLAEAMSAAGGKFDSTNNTASTDAEAQRFVVNYIPMSQAAVINVSHDNTENGSGSSDSSAQNFRVSYKANYQSAYIRIQQNSPINTGSMIESVTGVTDGSMTFSTTDSNLATNVVVDSSSPIKMNSAVDSAAGVTSGSISFAKTDSQLAVSGYTYVVYAPNGSSYATLSAATAANNLHNFVDQSGKTISPATSATGPVGSNIPDGSKLIQGYTLISSSGDTDGKFDDDLVSTITYTYKAQYQAKSGYTYVVHVYDQMGSAASLLGTYTTLASAVAAQKYDNTQNATNARTDAYQQQFKVVYSPRTATVTSAYAGTTDTSSQAFIVTYKTNQYANLITSAVDTSGNSLLNYSAISEIANGPASSTISFSNKDSQLACPLSAGTTFASTSGATNTSISFATNDGGLVRAGYTYTVTYAGSDKPDSVAYTTLSSALAAHPRYDSPLSTAGYTYVVKGPNGSTYSTLSSAVAANSIYDATNNSAATDSSAQVFTVSYIGQTQSAVIKYDPNTIERFDNTNNSGSSDGSYQTFTVNYRPVTQTTSLVVDGLSPIKAGSTVASSVGTTSAALTIPYTDAHTQNYTYDGSSYVTSGTASYMQGIYGPTDGSISFNTTDSALAKSGYTYTVQGPGGVTEYSTLASAQNASLVRSGYNYTVTDPNGSSYATMSAAYAAATNAWDSTANTAGVASDASPQNWTVNYTAQSQTAYLRANDVTVSQTAGNNVITIKYKGTVQQEAIVNTNKPELWNGSSAITSYWNIDQTKPLGGSSLASSIVCMSGTLSTGTTTVKYVDANGNTIKDPTTFVAAVGDIIGISGLSSGAKAGTDDMAFAAPTIRGYTASYPTGGPNGGPSIVATMTTNKTQNSESSSWTVDTAKAKVTLAPATALTVGLNAINGQNKNDQYASFDFGIDFHKNTDKNDPAEGPFGALRTTNSSGTLTATQGKQSGVAGTATYTDGYNLSNWSSTIKYTLTWTTKTFTVTGYLHPNVRDADQFMPRDYSDWTGLLLTPTDPNKIATAYDFSSKGGGGLGIEGMKNAYAPVSWNGSSAWNYSDVTGLGSYNGSTWTGDRAYGSTLYKDPAGAYYTKLVANGASTAGYTYLTRQFDYKKMYKSGKFWVVAGLTVVSLITANDTSKVFDLFSDRLGSVFAAQTNSSATIDTVTDADTATGGSREE
ncbi:MucBP domain-containing protein [Weissella confusa]|uniref:MucBP domain-containing protein n=1 Tax=Weissella confusa TaxID=1583 RepID=A0A923NKK0_WEICO|nr:MucBP domain-containing protein [Weissella confusa]